MNVGIVLGLCLLLKERGQLAADDFFDDLFVFLVDVVGGIIRSVIITGGALVVRFRVGLFALQFCELLLLPLDDVVLSRLALARFRLGPVILGLLFVGLGVVAFLAVLIAVGVRIVTISVVLVVCGLFAGLVPARRALSIRAVEALRSGT